MDVYNKLVFCKLLSVCSKIDISVMFLSPAPMANGSKFLAVGATLALRRSGFYGAWLSWRLFRISCLSSGVMICCFTVRRSEMSLMMLLMSRWSLILVLPWSKYFLIRSDLPQQQQQQGRQEPKKSWHFSPRFSWLLSGNDDFEPSLDLSIISIWKLYSACLCVINQPIWSMQNMKPPIVLNSCGMS